MSLKELKAALEYFDANHCSTDCQSSDAAAIAGEHVRRAWACVGAVEKAANVLNECRLFSLTDSNHAPVEEAAWLMESIAKEAEREALAELREFKASGKAPFLEDVLREMEALTRMKDEHGEYLSLPEMYERACWANPGVRAVLILEAIRSDSAARVRDIVDAPQSESI